MAQDYRALRRWLKGDKKAYLKFSDLWKVLLLNLADRAADMVDEEGHSVTKRTYGTYSYDLALIAEREELLVSYTDLQRAASHFEQHGWAKLTRRQPVLVQLTGEGIGKAQEIIDEVFDSNDMDLRSRAPATDRFVRLDDNSLSYETAIIRLEALIKEAADIRVNDWPEKDGVIEALKSALGMIRTKYVNKAAVIAAVSSATMFILIKFAEAPIADLATATWKAVKALF
jgi:hypothetical protein